MAWEKLLALVIDDGQRRLSDQVQYGFRSSRFPRDETQWQDVKSTTIDELARRIVRWLWS